MKRLALLASFSVLVFAQQSSSNSAPKSGYYDATSDRQDSDGVVTHLSGHVTIETDTFILQADEVEYDIASGEFRANGHVLLKTKKK
jgi:lipopolysaccharide assembly outer membrane protein LptD (OstA)